MNFRNWLEGQARTIPVIHNTTPESFVSIMREGFSIKHMGRSAKMTKYEAAYGDPHGIYFVMDRDDAESDHIPSHPFATGMRGVRIYGTAFLNNPLEMGQFVWDKEARNTVSYKTVLANKYGKTKAPLTRALIKEGYDGIVTDSEICVFSPSQVTINVDKTIAEIARFRWYWENIKKIGPEILSIVQEIKDGSTQG